MPANRLLQRRPLLRPELVHNVGALRRASASIGISPVSQLGKLSGGSTATALRHIEHLEALGYIGRGSDPDDRRRANVTMLAPLFEAVEHLLDVHLAASRIDA